jgi:hypothetical protein
VYSPLIVDRALHALKAKGMRFQRRAIEESIDISAKMGKILDKDGNPQRPWTAQEQEFMRSEVILCRHDFRYWADRYGIREITGEMGGGIGPSPFFASQERALELIAAREEENYKSLAKHGFSEGILAVWHKSRQQGATVINRLITGHRMIFYPNTRAITASLDISKVDMLYAKDKVWYDNLPFFMKPELEYDVKAEHIAFKTLKSRLAYEQANQKAGVGTSGQFDMAHMTEVALWPNPWRLRNDFFPTIPQSHKTFIGFESTAWGRGKGNFWWEFTEDVRKKHRGFESWIYVFTPWYINPIKNRRVPPEGWAVSSMAKDHADMVERTSPEFTGGHTIRLTDDQVYWWESEFEQARKSDDLPAFFTNYCATPEQSFQHSRRSALPYEVIEKMRARALNGMPYAIAHAEAV